MSNPDTRMAFCCVTCAAAMELHGGNNTDMMFCQHHECNVSPEEVCNSWSQHPAYRGEEEVDFE